MAHRNKAIHTRNDTLERSGNNAAHALVFARLAAAYAIELGEGELGETTALAVPEPATHGWRNLALALGLGLAGLAAVRRRLI